jgi:hypothetical protein
VYWYFRRNSGGFMKKTVIAVMVISMAVNLFAQTVVSDFETDGKGTIVKYVGFDNAIVIPKVINGEQIIVIGEKAFENCDLVSVTIPVGITSIGKSAFSRNKLTSIAIPEGVMVIETGAFSVNPLAEATIPSSLIETNGNFSRIGTMTLDEGIICDANDFRGNIFYDYVCNDRKAGTYRVDSEWNIMSYVNSRQRFEDIDYYATENGAAIIQYKGTASRFRIPEQLNEIPVKAILGWSTERLSVVVIPNGVSYIGNRVFGGHNLSSINLPATLTYIGDNAFAGNKITSVIIPEGVTYIGSEAFLDNNIGNLVLPPNAYIDKFAFSSLRSDIDELIIPSTIKKIGEHAFGGVRIKNLIIENGQIGNVAFENANIESLTIKNSLIKIGGSAFRNVNIKKIIIASNVDLEGSGLGYNSRFSDYYNNNGKKAGIYSYAQSSSGRWIWTYSEK